MTVKKTKLPCLEHILKIDSLTLHFEYIDNLLLRKNIAIIFQYLLFLVALDENHSLPGAISYLIYKDMIIQTASIAEAMLCYVLAKGIDKKKTSLEIMDIHDEDKYKNFVELYEINSKEIVGGVIKTVKLIDPQHMQFKQLIRAAIHSKIIDSTLETELTTIRKTRNKIHLSTLDVVDNSYNKTTVIKTFDTVKKLKTSIISYLH